MPITGGSVAQYRGFRSPLYPMMERDLSAGPYPHSIHSHPTHLSGSMLLASTSAPTLV